MTSVTESQQQHLKAVIQIFCAPNRCKPEADPSFCLNSCEGQSGPAARKCLAKRFSTLSPSVLPLSAASCWSQFRNSHNIYDFKSWISTIVRLANADFPLTPRSEVNVGGGLRDLVEGTKRGAKKLKDHNSGSNQPTPRQIEWIFLEH